MIRSLYNIVLDTSEQVPELSSQICVSQGCIHRKYIVVDDIPRSRVDVEEIDIEHAISSYDSFVHPNALFHYFLSDTVHIKSDIDISYSYALHNISPNLMTTTSSIYQAMQLQQMTIDLKKLGMKIEMATINSHILQSRGPCPKARNLPPSTASKPSQIFAVNQERASHSNSIKQPLIRVI